MSTIPVLPEPANANGELVLVRIAVDPHLLEDVLEALAHAPFPINPQIIHRSLLTKVEFPAYSSQMDAVRTLISANGLAPGCLEVVKMMAAMDCPERFPTTPVA